jgi:hypothetical protein
MGSFQRYFGKAIAVDRPDASQCLEASEHISVFLL